MLNRVSLLFRLYWRCGPFVIGTAALTFSLTALAIKLIGDTLPPFETVSTSGLFCLVTLTGILWRCGLPLLPSSTRIHSSSLSTAAEHDGGGSSCNELPAPLSIARVTLLTLLRGVLGSAATTAFILSLELLSLKDAVTLFFTSPVIALLLDWLLAGRLPGCGGAAATGLTLTGALLVTQPPFLFGGAVASHKPHHPGLLSVDATATGTGSDGGGLSSTGVALALAAAAANASGFVTIGLLKGRQPPLVLTWWYNLVLVAMTVSPLALRWPLPPRLPSRRGALLLLAVGCTQLVAQLCLNRGFQLEPAGRGAAINVLQVLFSFILDVAVLGDIPSPLSVAGSALVAAGVLFVALSSQARARRQNGSGGSGGGDGAVTATTTAKLSAVSSGADNGGGGVAAHRIMVHAEGLVVVHGGAGGTAAGELNGGSLREPLLLSVAAAAAEAGDA